MLEMHCPPLNLSRVAHKMSAMLEWHFPPLYLPLGGSQKVCYLGVASFSFTLGWLTKRLLRWNGFYLL